MSDVTWMRGAMDEEMLSDGREHLRNPFLGTIRDGTQRAIHTDGHALLWGDGEPTTPNHERVPKLDASFWGSEPTKWLVFDRATLLAWAKETVACARCDGAGVVMHSCDCRFCEEGYAFDDCPGCGGQSLGEAGGGIFDRVKLAALVERMDADEVRVAVDSEGFRLELRGDKRGALLMGVKNIKRRAIAKDCPAPKGTR